MSELEKRRGMEPAEARTADLAERPIHDGAGHSNEVQARWAAYVRNSGPSRRLSEHELDARARLLEFIGAARGRQAVELILMEIDSDHSGSVRLSEFKTFMKHLGYGFATRQLVGGTAFNRVRTQHGDPDSDLTADHLLALLIDYGLG